MGEAALILKKLENLEIRQDGFDGKLDAIGKALSDIAVQQNEIGHLQNQTRELWEKYNETHGPNGIISEIRTFQATCPREAISIEIKRQWATICLLATLVTGALLKAFGVV